MVTTFVCLPQGTLLTKVYVLAEHPDATPEAYLNLYKMGECIHFFIRTTSYALKCRMPYPAGASAIGRPGARSSTRWGSTALKVNPDPVLIATKGALWGSVKAHGLLTVTVIVSDDAGQFKIGSYGLCWVHAERLVHKLDTFTDESRAAQATVRELIWRFYADLKTYRCASPAAQGCAASAVQPHLHAQHWLRHPRPSARVAQRQQVRIVDGARSTRIPLHTSGSENVIRSRAQRRHPQ